jgi:hypothetical protein
MIVLSQKKFNFDQDWKNYIHLWYEINIFRFIMKSIFRIYLVDVINIGHFLYKFGQSWENLAYDNPKTSFFLDKGGMS